MSMTRAACDMAGNLDIVFVHSARTPNDVIFHTELTRMQAAMPGLRVISVCEGPGDTAQWQQPIGRLDLSLLSQHVPDYKEREIFTCGPWATWKRSSHCSGKRRSISPTTIRKASTSPH
ncbi:hypothetical protein THH46_20540 [Pseudomonas sp. NA13]